MRVELKLILLLALYSIISNIVYLSVVVTKKKIIVSELKKIILKSIILVVIISAFIVITNFDIRICFLLILGISIITYIAIYKRNQYSIYNTNFDVFKDDLDEELVIRDIKFDYNSHNHVFYFAEYGDAMLELRNISLNLVGLEFHRINKDFKVELYSIIKSILSNDKNRCLTTSIVYELLISISLMIVYILIIYNLYLTK